MPAGLPNVDAEGDYQQQRKEWYQQASQHHERFLESADDGAGGERIERGAHQRARRELTHQAVGIGQAQRQREQAAQEQQDGARLLRAKDVAFFPRLLKATRGRIELLLIAIRHTALRGGYPGLSKKRAGRLNESLRGGQTDVGGNPFRQGGRMAPSSRSSSSSILLINVAISGKKARM